MLACSASLPSFSSCHGTLWPWHFQGLVANETLNVSGLDYHWMASVSVPVMVYLRLTPHLHCLRHHQTFFVVLVSMITSQLCKFF
jgi:hypothetical protein